jgi:hypothetical protein
MPDIYLIINKDDFDEYIILKTYREISDYLNEYYNIKNSHMYYQRILSSEGQLIIDNIIIIHIIL